MALSFGTSGVRGLETELTDEACSQFARAFVRHYRSLGRGSAESRNAMVIGGDLRRSTPRIMEAIARGLAAEGCKVLDAGVLPTPALASECIVRGLPGIVVTGSHIPADRNGIKFYFPWGEVLKADEAPILAHVAALEKAAAASGAESRAAKGTPTAQMAPPAQVQREKISAGENFVERYAQFFGPKALAGMKIAFYEHSTAGRDLTPRILERLGATVVRFGRSQEFIPVDTEALENVQALANELKKHGAHALLSADGDGDRPLLLDDRGEVVRGDQLGILGALALEADSVSTPVSSSTALEKTGKFREIRRCKIGSPFVVAEMEAALEAGKKRVIGFEANGGFLLGSPIEAASGLGMPGARLTPLPTRDSVLPPLLALAAATRRGISLSQLVAELPPRYTVSDLIRPFAVEKSRAVLALLQASDFGAVKARWEAELGKLGKPDLTDGVRLEFADSDILHFRPSGNAPEFRIYSEASSEARATELNRKARQWVESLAN